MPHRSALRQLLPLIVWAPLAAFLSLASTPVLPSMIVRAHAFGLFCLWLGAVIAIRGPLRGRLIAGFAFLTAAVWAAWQAHDPFFIMSHLVYGVAGVAFGVAAVRSLADQSLQVLTGFSVGYALGLVLGLLGSAGCAILGAFTVRRTDQR